MRNILIERVHSDVYHRVLYSYAWGQIWNNVHDRLRWRVHERVYINVLQRMQIRMWKHIRS